MCVARLLDVGAQGVRCPRRYQRYSTMGDATVLPCTGPPLHGLAGRGGSGSYIYIYRMWGLLLGSCEWLCEHGNSGSAVLPCRRAASAPRSFGRAGHEVTTGEAASGQLASLKQEYTSHCHALRVPLSMASTSSQSASLHLEKKWSKAVCGKWGWEASTPHGGSTM